MAAFNQASRTDQRLLRGVSMSSHRHPAQQEEDTYDDDEELTTFSHEKEEGQ